jgi:hypothetical protein
MTKVITHMLMLFFLNDLLVSELAALFAKPLESLPVPPAIPLIPVTTPVAPPLVETNIMPGASAADDTVEAAPCWWFENVPKQITVVAIRKIPHSILEVFVSSDTLLIVRTTISLSPTELHSISESVGMPDVSTLEHAWTIENGALNRETRIHLKYPLFNLATIALDNDILTVISYPMRKQQLLNFVSK